MKIQLRSVMNIAQTIGARQTFFELAEPSTLRDLLKELTAAYGQEFYDAVCDETGYPDDKVAILINGDSAAAIGGVDVRINDGDDVLILPIIDGG